MYHWIKHVDRYDYSWLEWPYDIVDNSLKEARVTKAREGVPPLVSYPHLKTLTESYALVARAFRKMPTRQALKPHDKGLPAKGLIGMALTAT